MSGPNRLLGVLQLFENGDHVWTVEEIGQELGISVSTAYRLVRELVKAGFLDPVTGAGYTLGPAFIRYDRILRQSDSLTRIAGPIMRTLLSETSQSATAVLCRRFKDCVMCVHEVRSENSRAQISYERGVAMPMFFGATSKAILAQLPDRLLRRIYLANENKIRQSLPTQDWITFKNQLREIRRAGFAITEAEVSPGPIGVAAPISRGDQVVASVSLIIAANGCNRKRAEKLVPAVIDAATKISGLLSKKEPIIPR
jgi:DNA-binding IclR family transcriptional regulator